MITPTHPTGAERKEYTQSYRQISIFLDRFTDQFFIGDCHGEQFGSVALCEDEIDRRMDNRGRKIYAGTGHLADRLYGSVW